MKQQGAGRGREDDWWWRELYGDGPEEGAGDEAGDAERPDGVRPDDASDTLDDRIESALRTVRTVRRDSGPGGASKSAGASESASSGAGAGASGASPGPSAADATAADRSPSEGAALAGTGSEGSGSGELALGAFEPRPWEPSGWEPRPWELPARSKPFSTPSAPLAPPEPTTREPAARSLPDACGFPEADPDALDELVPDTVVEGAAFGSAAVRAVARRGADARRRGAARGAALLTARFGTGRDALLLIAVATAAPAAPRAARDACTWLGGAIGRSAAQLARDLRTGRTDALRAGLQRLTNRAHGKLRTGPPEPTSTPPRTVDPPSTPSAPSTPGPPPAALRCLLLSADPGCRTRVFFGVGAGGLFRLRDGGWADLEPGDGTPFRFRAEPGRPGDVLLLCGPDLAGRLGLDPDAAARLAAAWSAPAPPDPADFLTAVRPQATEDVGDRTAVGVWEA
ncbi:protein phosphatase 2C domain-containing protein [Streptomyces sp. NPDC057743]|uniref:protein phosphatase 2C domain-containing protein n=1 Tax=Streptomyces sp. NPDC057743 TaxID=3346236 RepID=UPI00368FC49F